MSEQAPLKHWLRELIQARDTGEATARQQAAFFQVTLLSTAGLILVTLAVMIAVTWPVELTSSFWLNLGLAVLSLIGVGVLYWFSRRGHYRRLARWYVVGFYGLIVVTCWLYDGFWSGSWVFLIWILTLAALFLPRQVVLWMLGAGLVSWLAMGLLEWAGLYHPWLRSGPGPQTDVIKQLFTLNVTVVTVPLIMLAVHYLDQMRQRWQAAAQELEVHRQTLEQQVAIRTAEVRQRADEFQAVAELGQIVLWARELNSMLQEAVHFIAERLGFYQVGIFLVDESKQWLVLEAASSQAGREISERKLQLRVGEQGIVGHVAATRRLHVAADVSQDPYYFGVAELANTRSEVALPLIYRGNLVGVLDVQSHHLAAFSSESLRVLEVLAGNLAVAIENVRHAEEVQRTVERLTRYQEEETLKLWQKTLRRHAGRLNLAYDRARVTRLPATAPGLAAEEAPSGRLVTTITPEGWHRLSVPLYIRLRPVGHFVFEAEHPWTTDELNVVQAVVTQLGLALENVQLLEESRQRAIFERTVGEITATIRREVQIETVLERALAELGKALGSERAMARLSLMAAEAAVDSTGTPTGDPRPEAQGGASQ